MAWRLGKASTSTAVPKSAPLATVADLPHVSRDYYLEHPAIAALTHEEAEAIRASLAIRILGVSGDEEQARWIPNPVGSFLQVG